MHEKPKDPQEPQREILVRSAKDALGEGAAKNLNPALDTDLDKLDKLVAKFGVHQDAENLLASLRKEGPEALIRHLQSGDFKEGVANLFLIPRLEAEECVNERFFVAAAQSPNSAVALSGLAALLTTESKELPTQLAIFLGRQDVACDEITTALEMIKAVKCNKDPEVGEALKALHTHPDQQIAQKAKELTPNPQKDAAKRLLVLFDKLNQNSGDASNLTTADKKLMKRAAEELRSRSDLNDGTK